MKNQPTRRRFFGQAGAALVAPLVATAVTAATAAESQAKDDVAARLARLEDLNAIRALLPALLANPARLALGATVRSIAANGDDAIAVAANGTATARLGCTVEAATPIDGRGTLVEMARLQGDGFVVRSEHGVLVTAFVKRDGNWKFESAKFEGRT
jgi:hypothetical protein